MEITANEIKTRGVSALNGITESGTEALITVNGKVKYVVIPIAKYTKLRELELELALNESLNDFESGKYHLGVDEHLKRIADV